MTAMRGNVMDKPTVISILTLNNLPLLKQCIESIATNTSVPHRICVVDQATSDGSADYLDSLGDSIDVIHSARNLGFVTGNNRVMERYPDNDMVLLNDDTIVKEGWLNALKECAYSSSEIGIVGAKLLYPDGRLQEAGGEIFQDGSGRNIGKNDDPERHIYNVRRDVDYCSGACLFIKRQVLNRIGYLDEIFSPAYWEDTDLCFRARKAGYRVIYEPSSEIIHFEGATAGSPSRKSLSAQLQERNKPKFMARWGEELKQHRKNVFETPSTPGRDKILIIMPFLPMYDRAAGEKRWFHTLKIINKHFDIVFLARNGLGQLKYVNRLEEMGITVFHTDQSRLSQMGIDARGPVWIDLPLLLKSNDFSAVIVGFYHMAHQYYRDIRTYSPRSFFIIDSFDVCFIRQRRRAELGGDPKEIWQALETKRLELDMYRKADMVLTVTEQDRERLLEVAPDLRVGISTDIHPVLEDLGQANRENIVFVGNYKHDPNVDAVLYFVENIWPGIKHRLPDVKFYIVGNSPTEEIEALASDDIIVTGFVPEVTPYLLESKVFVVPLRYGAGLKGKIGEALAGGIPIATTSIGAEGMHLVHGKNAMIADEPDEFADRVAELYTDSALWQELASEGRDHAIRNYSYEAVEAYWHEVFAAIRHGRQESKQQPQSRKCLKEAGFKRLDPLPEMVPNVSIVIPVHNNLGLTQDCWTSIRKNTPTPYELVIVDNGSTEDVAYDAGQNNIRVIRNESNRGFAYACNQGIQATHGDYVVILNNDTIVTPGWLERLIWHIKQDESVGIVGPSTSFASTVQQVRTDYKSERGLYDFSERIYGENMHQAAELEKIVGVCMLMRRKMLDEIGLFDTRFRLGNYEDDDICLRARIAGYKVLWAKDTYIHHKGSKTFELIDVDYPRLMEENRGRFAAKWAPVATEVGLDAPDSSRVGKAVTPSEPALCERPVLVVGNGKCIEPEVIDNLLRYSEGSSVVVISEGQTTCGAGFDKTRVKTIPKTDDKPLSVLITEFVESSRSDTIFLVNPQTVVTAGWMKPLEIALSGDNVGCALSTTNAGWGNQQTKAGYKRIGKPLARFARRNALAWRGRIEEIQLGRPAAMGIKRDILLQYGLPDRFVTDALLLELQRRLIDGRMRVLCAKDSYVHLDDSPSDVWCSEQNAVVGLVKAHNSLADDKADLAFKHIEQALESKPDYTEAFFERGVLRALGGMDEEAIQDFEEVIRLKPADSRAYNNLGCLLFSQGKTEKAEVHFIKAAETWNQNWEAKRNLADLYLQTGRAQEAMDLYSSIMNENPECPDVYISLGQIFAACGDLTTGEQCFRMALRITPDNPAAQQGLSAIELARKQPATKEGTAVETTEC
jgi:GT2 family glycosyltransferase/Tfp pilus assembly protein PilF